MDKSAKIFVAGGTGMVGSAIIRRLIAEGFENIISNYHKRKPYAVDLQPQTSTLRPQTFNLRPPTPNLQPQTSNLNLDLCRFYQLDLTRQVDVEKFFQQEKPEYVFLAAAKVGGIMANYNYPAEFIYSNLMVQTNIIHSAYLYGVKKLLFLGSSCIYPRLAPQPMKEEHLLTGELEPTNEPYAVAKIAGIRMCQSYNRQYGTNFISVMPTNLYGPNDNFDLETSHVLPALIRKFHDAKISMDNLSSSSPLTPHASRLTPHALHSTIVELWGTGSPFREFLHVDDLADACVFVIQNVDAVSLTPHASRPSESPEATQFTLYDLLNIGSGKDVTIKELADIVKDVVGFKGETIWDSTKPDGTPRKLLDISRMRSLGWEPKIGLRDGIKTTYDWYVNNCL